MLRLVLFALALSNCAAIGFPGVDPRQWDAGDKVNLKVNRIDSIKTQLPFDYYSLPFCQPDEITPFAENLGEALRGESIENSLYELNMLMPVTCQTLCSKKYTAKELKQFEERVLDEYRVHWMVDNLPAATRVKASQEMEEEYSYQRGYPLGYVENGKAYVHNHVRILMKYRQSIDNTYEGSRIVGFEVEPYSINHKTSDSRHKSCAFLSMEHPERHQNTDAQSLDESAGSEIVWTYDVKWEMSDVRWAGRWDMYMLASSSDTVHWFSIINSLVLVLILAFVVAMIMCRTLNSDIDLYNMVDIDDPEELKEETGWKLVHGDVFRPPAMNNLLCALVGSGVQLYMCTLITLSVACAGFLGPANRGGLATALLIFFSITGVFGGFTSASLYKMFKGVDWKFNVALVGFLYPSIVAGSMFILNLFIWYQGSSLAVPFGHMMIMLFLWVGIYVPLTGVGAYLGLRRAGVEMPCVPHQIPRLIPANSMLNDGGMVMNVIWCLVGGLVTFVPVFIEVFFIMSSIWLHHYTYMFGFLLLVFLILSITSAEVSIVMCYFQLVNEDYHWWWRSFLSAGSSALFLFLYSIHYFYTNLEISSGVSTLMYFVNMGVASLTFFLITGSIGVLSCLFFTTKIYAAIKVD